MSNPYASGSDLVARYDFRTIADLCEDNGIRPTNVTADPNVLACLLDAASAINSAALVGDRYTVAQLQALTGVDGAILKRLNSDLAFIYLCLRRGLKPPLWDVTYKNAMDMLAELKNGTLIFNIPGIANAGVPVEEFPSCVTYQTVNTVRAFTANNLFPVRRVQKPTSGGYSSNS